MTCYRCGAEIEEWDDCCFCPVCGIPLSVYVLPVKEREDENKVDND